MCAQWTHASVRNKLRRDRFECPVHLDEDVVTALLLWKFKDEKNFPTFYEPAPENSSKQDDDDDDDKSIPSRRSRLISSYGEEWLLGNKHLADQFLDECDRLALNVPSTSTNGEAPTAVGIATSIPANGHDRYERLFTEDLHRNCTYPLWPEGVSGIVPLLLWAGSYLYRYDYIWANRVWWFLLCSHSVEAVLVFFWMMPVGFSYMCTFTWFVFSFVNGWPCTYRAKLLAEISLKKADQQQQHQSQQRGRGQKARRGEVSLEQPADSKRQPSKKKN